MRIVEGVCNTHDLRYALIWWNSVLWEKATKLSI